MNGHSFTPQSGCSTLCELSSWCEQAHDEEEFVDCIFCVARREINALRDQGVNLLAKLRQAEDRLRWVNDHRIREFSDSELRSELARRQRMEDMLADDEMWSHS